MPGAVGAYFACPASTGRMTLALVAASLGTLAMCLGLMAFRNAVPGVQPVADLNNLLLPLWMIILGVSLEALESWISQCVGYVAGLPPKKLK